MKVNLGCGDKPCQAVGWTNVDSFEGVEPDIVADVMDLPFDDGSCEMVYAGHILEHLVYHTEIGARRGESLTSVTEMLLEVRRILAPYGTACFVGPDYDRAVNDPTATPEQLHEIIHGNHDRPGAEHQWLSTATKNHQAIRQVFPDAWEVDILALSEHWPVVYRATWQFAILSQ